MAGAPGGGKYDKELDELMAKLGADGAVVIVLGGSRGSGFGCAIRGYAFESFREQAPAILRKVADDIEGWGQNG